MALITDKLSLSIAGKTLCKQLNISFKPGQFWGIMGINGVGKTTLLNTLIGLHKEDEGTIALNQKAINQYPRLELAQKMGMMLQEYEYNFPSTVLEASLIARHPFLKAWQWESDADKVLAHQALQQVGIDALSERLVNTLSGGEKRRLNLAMLLTQNPEYYLLDEPINHLDIKAQIEVLSLLKAKFTDEKKCGIMVIHDPNLAYRFCNHMLLLFEQGQWLAGAAKDILTTDNLSNLYDCPIHQISDATQTVFIPQ